MRILKFPVFIFGALFFFLCAVYSFSATDVLRLLNSTSLGAPPGFTSAQSINMDSEGNLFCAMRYQQGISSKTGIIKYNSNLSVQSSSFTTEDISAVMSIVLNSSDNVYVGVSQGFLKFDSDLVFQSSVTLGPDLVQGIVVNPNTSDTYVMGRDTVSKYNSSLVFQSSSVLSHAGYAVGVNSASGDVYVSASSVVVVGPGALGISRFNSNLVFQSSVNYSASGLALDSLGNLYASHQENGKIWVRKFSGDLFLLSSVSYDAQGNDRQTKIDLDSSGNVYVAGTLKSDGISDQILVLKLDPSLILQEVVSPMGPRGGGYDVAVGGSQNAVYVAGETNQSGGQTLWIGKLGVLASSSLGSAYGYPTPFSRSIASEMTFLNLTPSARVKIFSLGGYFIRQMEANSSGVAKWDVRDAWGKDISPGTYMVVAEDSKEKKRFKVMILP